MPSVKSSANTTTKVSNVFSLMTKVLSQTTHGRKNVCITIVKNKMQNLLVVITVITNGINSIPKTKILLIIQLGQLLVAMTTIVKIVSNVASTIIKVQINSCQMTAILSIMRPGQPFFLATIMPIIHRIVLQVVTTPQAIMILVALHGAVTHGAVMALMAVALAEVGKQKKDLHKCASLF